MTRRRLGAIAALVTLAVLGGAGGATAAWTASASVSASASSATIATTAQLTSGLDLNYRSGTTAPAAAGQLTIANTGGAPLSYTLATQLAVGSSSVLARKVTLRLWSGSACGTTAPSGAVSTTLADSAPALPTAARSLAPGASTVVCVATQIDGQVDASLSGQSVTAAFRVTGAIGTNWTTSATTAAFTQSASGLGPAGAPTCTQAPPHGVQLSWTAPANRAAGATLLYRVVDRFNAVVKEVSSSAASVSVTLGDSDIRADGVHELRIVTIETTGSTVTSSDSSTLTVRRTAVGGSNVKYECVIP